MIAMHFLHERPPKYTIWLKIRQKSYFLRIAEFWKMRHKGSNLIPEAVLTFERGLQKIWTLVKSCPHPSQTIDKRAMLPVIALAAKRLVIAINVSFAVAKKHISFNYDILFQVWIWNRRGGAFYAVFHAPWLIRFSFSLLN